jgi:hypothetical protein
MLSRERIPVFVLIAVLFTTTLAAAQVSELIFVRGQKTFHQRGCPQLSAFSDSYFVRVARSELPRDATPCSLCRPNASPTVPAASAPPSTPARSTPVASSTAQPTGERVDIGAELASLTTAIAAATEEEAKYSGGLIKSLLAVRLATLRQTQAMLAQRAAATDFNVALRYTVDGRPFAVPAGLTLAEVEGELTVAAGKVAAQEAEAARYRGGLIQAMALTTLATLKQSAAMLDQKRLAIKYGLPQFVGFADGVPSASQSTATAPTPSTVTPPTDSSWEIVSVDSRVTESNSSWWKYAWKLTIRNRGTQPIGLDATIEFQDGDGFVVDSDNEYGLVVGAGAEQTFTGFDLVDSSVAANVKRTNAKVRRQQ